MLAINVGPHVRIGRRAAVMSGVDGFVRIEVTVALRQLRLSVTVDGRGFDPGATEGQGLRSMQRRASDLGGSLQVVSHTGSGTHVTLTIPLH
jgi:signal transduction histidine kinase